MVMGRQVIGVRAGSLGGYGRQVIGVQANDLEGYGQVAWVVMGRQVIGVQANDLEGYGQLVMGRQVIGVRAGNLGGYGQAGYWGTGKWLGGVRQVLYVYFEDHSLPIMVHFDVPIILELKPKLEETALLFYRVTDVPFLPKWTNEPN